VGGGTHPYVRAMTARPFELWLHAHFDAHFDAQDESEPKHRALHDSRTRHSHEHVTPVRDDDARDVAFVAAVRDGNAEQFAAWYDTLYDEAWRFAYRFVRDTALASDVVHDVFLSIWEHRATWTVRGSARNYVLGAIRHRALNTRRHERIVARAASSSDVALRTPPGMGDAPRQPDAVFADAALHDAMHRAVANLPERQRSALALRWEHGLSNVEIAGVLGVGEAAVSRLLGRATETLRTVWDRLAE
jgi:RNA polymerase sigma factor (sigma-70 family)